MAVAQKAPLEQRHAVCATISTAVALLDFNNMNTYAFEASQVTSAFPISVDSAEPNFPVLPSAKVPKRLELWVGPKVHHEASPPP